MSAYVLPNIILFVAIVGVIAIVARRLPEGVRKAEDAARSGLDKAEPAWGRWWFLALGLARKTWRFILEAKGLHDPLASRFRMRQLLAANKKKVRSRTSKVNKQPEQVASSTPEAVKVVTTEQRPALKRTSMPRVTTVHESPLVVHEEPKYPSPEESRVAEEAMHTAKQLLDEKKYYEARKVLEHLEKELAYSPVFWARLGFAQYNLGVYGEAIRCYEKSLTLDSNQPNRYYNLALAYESAKNRPQALVMLNKAIELSGSNPKFEQTRQALLS